MLDLEGKYLAPGLIDGHTHLESSMLDVGSICPCSGAARHFGRGYRPPRNSQCLWAGGYEVCDELCPPFTPGAFLDGSFLCASYPP